MNEETTVNEKTQPGSGRFFIFFLAAAGVAAFDQWTKRLVRRDVPLNTSWLPEAMEWLLPYARLHHIQNRGASFGMLQNGNFVFIALSLVIVAGILFYVSRLEHPDPWMWAAGGMYLGGALGNLIDRLLFGAVTDFISVGTFYIFNAADAFINISVAILIWMSIREARKLEAAA